MDTPNWKKKPEWALKCSTKQYHVKFGDAFAERVLDPDLDSKLNGRLTEFWPERRSGFPGPLAVSLLRKDFPTLLENDYRILPKSDGVRFMMITFTDDKFVFDMFNRAAAHFLITNVKLTRRVFSGCVFDGELVTVIRSGRTVHEYMIFDCLVALGTSVRNRTYEERIQLAREIIRDNYRYEDKDPFRIVVKSTISPALAIELLYKDKQDLEDPNDGVILVNNNHPYIGGRDDKLFKYKKVEDHTVDFVANAVDEEKVELFVIENNNYEIVHTIKVTDEDLARLGVSSIQALKQVIIECYYDIIKGWIPLKLRNEDKDIPNNRITYERTMENICERILPKEVYNLLNKS